MVINVESISFINYDQIDDLIITGELLSGVKFQSSGILAIEIVMMVKPSIMEGRRLRWPKYVWLVHNLIAHPLMSILALFGLYKLAFLIHDKTVPKPIGVKVKK